MNFLVVIFYYFKQKASGKHINLNSLFLISFKLMSKTVIKTPDAPAPIGPYNQAILAGNMLFISGQICIDPATGELKNKDVQEEIPVHLFEDYERESDKMLYYKQMKEEYDKFCEKVKDLKKIN